MPDAVCQDRSHQRQRQRRPSRAAYVFAIVSTAAATSSYRRSATGMEWPGACSDDASASDGPLGRRGLRLGHLVVSVASGVGVQVETALRNYRPTMGLHLYPIAL